MKAWDAITTVGVLLFLLSGTSAAAKEPSEAVTLRKRLESLRKAGATSGLADAAAARWKVVGGGVVRGLDRSTGQESDSFEPWVVTHEGHRRELEKLLLPVD